MFGRVSRRVFLQGVGGGIMTTASIGCRTTSARTAGVKSGADQKPQLKKALMYSMLPASLPTADRFKLAADLGFQGLEVQTIHDNKVVDTLRAAADKAGIRIHSIMNSESWKYPLSDNDPATVARGLDILRTSLHNAKAFGADSVLLIPAVVTPEVRYKDAWERSQREIRKVLPLARELGVIITIENVGNRFLLSPLEFPRYIDQINDPYLQAYFDIGNSLILWGYPQDWLLTLGARIRKIHLKDCDWDKKRFVLLRDGD
ncbi:MAG: sugar phosphate isomerase/epimerase, partial [Planctomycetota bacterium]